MLAHFRVPETPDKKLWLHPYQVAALREALRRDSSGKFVYSLILWGDIKKSIKSTIAGAIALWTAWQRPWGSVKIVGNDLKQADSRAAFYARRAVELHPEMAKEVSVKPSGYMMTFPNRARIEAIPVDPKGEAGGNDDAVIYTELWAANSKAALSLWTETTLSPMKYGESFRWAETYAGYAGESPILEQLYQAGIKDGEHLDLSYTDKSGVHHDLSDLAAYRNQAARMFALWNDTPRLPWQTAEYYAQESASLVPHEFDRVHRNRWASSQNAFVPAAWWEACRGELPVMAKDAPVVVAADAAISGDTFGVIAVSGREGSGDLDIRYSRAWKPPAGGKIDFSEVEAEIMRLFNWFNVIELAYDPYQLYDMGSRFQNSLVVNTYSFTQGQERLVADKALLDMIRDRRIHHGGDTDLSEHVTNANAKSEGEKLRIVKRAEHMKIDLCVALSMAAARAAFWNI